MSSVSQNTRSRRRIVHDSESDSDSEESGSFETRHPSRSRSPNGKSHTNRLALNPAFVAKELRNWAANYFTGSIDPEPLGEHLTGRDSSTQLLFSVRPEEGHSIGASALRAFRNLGPAFSCQPMPNDRNAYLVSVREPTRNESSRILAGLENTLSDSQLCAAPLCVGILIIIVSLFVFFYTIHSLHGTLHEYESATDTMFHATVLILDHAYIAVLSAMGIKTGNGGHNITGEHLVHE